MYFLSIRLLLIISVSLTAARIVQLPNGRIRGLELPNYYAFTNVRYAEPPTRFEPSVSFDRNWSGVQNATGEILSCVPFGKRTNYSDGQEDCLILNIFAPRTASSTNLLPVFLFIHGGAFMFASSAYYSPEVIMTNGNMVMVSINYRLGPLGFLSTGDGAIQGNLGLKDQLLALRWVKNNIHLFGGNPERILLLGQSAGGASVHLHILRRETESLIAAAASLSGTAINPWVIKKNPVQQTATFSEMLNCPSAGEELKKCLQNRPLKDIHEAVLRMQPYLDYPFNVFGPIVESVDNSDAFLTEEPRKLMETGKISNIPWLASFTTDEGAYNGASLLEKRDNGIEYIEDLNDRWLELAPLMLHYYDEPSTQQKQQLSERLRQKYMGDRSFSRDTYSFLQRMFSDVLYVNGIRESIRLHRVFGQSPVYGYIYGNSHNYGIGNFLSKDQTYNFGATHGDDEELILPLTLATNYTADNNDRRIGRLLVEMFDSFALTETPRFGGITLPENENTDLPTQFLHIFREKYCEGPWGGYSNIECRSCICYDYPEKRAVSRS